VREGHAVDYYQGGYQAAEREARTARRGLWRGDFERPQDWRRRHPRAG
jgi:endonuclease YncB( thermonuclease family)